MSTLTPAQPHKGTLVIGREASYGAGLAAGFPLFKLPFLEFDPKPDKGMIDDPNMYGEPYPRDSFLQYFRATGTLKLSLNFEGQLEIFRLLHGASAYSSAVISGSVRDHINKWSDQLPTAACELVHGDVPAGRVTKITGMKLTDYTAKGDGAPGTGGLCTLEIPYMAKDMVLDQAPTVISITGITVSTGTPNVDRAAGDWNNDVRPGMGIAVASAFPAGTTVLSITSPTRCVVSNNSSFSLSAQTAVLTPNFPTNLPVMDRMRLSGFAAGVTDDGTADAVGNVRVRSWEVSYKQGHDHDRFYGSLNPDEALRNAFLEAKFTFMQEFLTPTAWNAHRSHTVGSPQLILRGDTNIGAGNAHELEFRGNKAYSRDVGAAIRGVNSMMQQTEWKCVRDATDVAALVSRIRSTEIALA